MVLQEDPEPIVNARRRRLAAKSSNEAVEALYRLPDHVPGLKSLLI